MSMVIGVWGVDHPHGGGHLKALEYASDVEKLLIWDPDPERARAAVNASRKAEAVAQIEPLAQSGELDAVVMLMPTREAGPATLKAIRAGLYVYGDKPGARTAAEMSQIVAAAEETGAHLCPCYPWRVDPVTQEIKRLIDGGVLGDIWSFEAKWLTSQVALRGASNWLFHDEVSGGGILSWLACHWIDLLAFLVGEPAQIAAKVSTRCGEDIDVEDTASVIIETESGAIGTVRAGYAHRPFWGYDESDLSLSFEGSVGSIYWPTKGDGGYRLRTGHPDFAGVARRWVQVERDAAPPEAGYSFAFLNRFLEAARQRTEPDATEKDALRVLQILEAAYTSSREGRHIAIP